MSDDSKDVTNFSHKLLPTNKQVSKLRETFPNISSADVKLSKTQLSKIVQSGGFICELLGPLLKTDLQLMKNVLTPWAKNYSAPLALTKTESAEDAGIHEKVSARSCILWT